MTFIPAPGYLPNYNPTLPFNKSIPGGLNVGMAIYIEGVINKDTKSEDKVAFNSRQLGQWGKEEMKNSFPFKEGERFELLVMVMQEHYKVTVNGNPFYDFVHRMPFQDVTHLHVHGDLAVQSINFSAVRSNLVSGIQLYTEGFPVYYPPVPYVVNLQGGLTANRTFIIKDFINLSADRFAISFRLGATGDMALHFSPHIQEGIVVRNSFQNGKWGPEEKDISYNPFGPGKSFDLSICTTSSGFQVFGNGQYMFDFQHRISSLNIINLLEITGDVLLSYVQV